MPQKEVHPVAAKPTANDKQRAARHALHQMDQLEATLTGWVLKLDREEVGDNLGSLYDKVQPFLGEES